MSTETLINLIEEINNLQKEYKDVRGKVRKKERRRIKLTLNNKIGQVNNLVKHKLFKPL